MSQQEKIPQRTLSQFKSNLLGGGTRPNLFEVQVNFPTTVDLGLQKDNPNSEFDQDTFRFLCKAASLPASNIANIDVPFRGRIFKVAGDRTFENWTVTVINDEHFNHYRAFQSWMQNIGQYGSSAGMNNPMDYMGQATVYQLGRQPSLLQSSGSTASDSRTIAQYKFEDIWPTTVSNIDLSYDSSDAIEEFTVDFQVQYWFPETAPDAVSIE
tara:strand:- start:791 stop:1426 length:636 start_codon:yes stop_codon:yes gene_type:complete